VAEENFFCSVAPTGRPHRWVTPFLGKHGQKGLSRHNFAATAPLPDLSTPLDTIQYYWQ